MKTPPPPLLLLRRDDGRAHAAAVVVVFPARGCWQDRKRKREVKVRRRMWWWPRWWVCGVKRIAEKASSDGLKVKWDTLIIPRDDEPPASVYPSPPSVGPALYNNVYSRGKTYFCVFNKYFTTLFRALEVEKCVVYRVEFARFILPPRYRRRRHRRGLNTEYYYILLYNIRFADERILYTSSII